MTPNQQQAIKRAVEKIWQYGTVQQPTPEQLEKVAAIISAELAAVPDERDAGLDALLVRLTTDDYVRCRDCPDQGWYADAEFADSDPEQVQCEFCYVETRSLFNLKEAIRARITAPVGSKEEK